MGENEMSRKEQRILRVLMECMTEGLPAKERSATWKRMLLLYKPSKKKKLELDEEDRLNGPLKEIKISKKEFHTAVLKCCEHGVAHEPGADYPEAGLDMAEMEQMDFESWMSSEDLMEIGQRSVVRKLRRLQDSEALRERLARRCAIKLI
jgi:hypothetical protein